MKLLLGFLFGLMLGGVVALVIASQMAAAQPGDIEVFEGDAPAEGTLPATVPASAAT